MVSVTVFTPTYNRAHTLTRLYESLCKQTCKDFEWLIVDDGSSDNTTELVEQFIMKENIRIRYFLQNNSGQHVAMNRGIQEADSLLFFMLDSDDYLPENAIELILCKWKTVSNDTSICGVVGNRCFKNGKVVGDENCYNEKIIDFLSYRSNLRIRGDRAEVVKTSIIKNYLYPCFEGEKSLPIAFIFNRMAQEYKALYFDECIYIADYLPDGMGAYWIRDRIKSPNGTAIYYGELTHYIKRNWRYKLRMATNYWRYAPYNKHLRFKDKIRQVGKWGTLLGWGGYFFYLIDKHRINRAQKQPGI